MERFRTIPLFLALLACGAGASGDDARLLHFPLNEGKGTVARDRSGRGLDGVVHAAWSPSPSGKGLEFDGKPAGVVTVQVPAPLRFGKGSWTFAAWLKPTRFAIDDRQNQRRVFSFGVFPDANLVIDLTGEGRPSWYFCYSGPGGTTASAGGSSSARLAEGRWAHLALVCDRERRKVDVYVNGVGQSTPLPADFAGDFSAGGELTLGSGWHNYWGLMDEVRVDRRALTRAEVRAEFERLKRTFGVVETPEALAARAREAAEEALEQGGAAWAAGDLAGARKAFSGVVQSAQAGPVLRSYAHLRVAQSHAAEGHADLARSTYAAVAATEGYPKVHRDEARERVNELDRAARGLAPRDPAATRTAVPRVAEFATRVVVSPRGNDAGDGSPSRPVAGLARARDLVRAARARGVRGAIAVDVMPGTYPVSSTLRLEAADSGTSAGPVVYRATEPGRSVFHGGVRLNGFEPVADRAVLDRLPAEARGKVYRCDLRAQGINDYGRLAVRGYGQPNPPPTAELFVDGRPMTLARWPNTGFVGIRKLVEPGSRQAGVPSIFEYLDDRHARWTGADDAWLFGYFRYLWADATIKVGRIDPSAHTLATAEAYQYGPPGMDTGQGIQYYAFNLLEELDRPGEWYLDRKAGVLYLYPPGDLNKATVELGMTSAPMVVMDRVTDVRLEGLTFDLGRSDGLVLTDCRRCLVAGCAVRRMAGNGISVHGGEAVGLFGCDVLTIGRRATEVIGGDRETLAPGRHFVENCRIADMGRIDRTYTPAIQLEGVGNRVAHNLMEDAPSSVMRIEGNDHVVEFNEVRHAVLESDDQGAMELFANPSYRGVVFRHNRFTDCGKSGPGVAVNGQAAIRFDDAISGMLVYGNVFARSANGHFGAIQINSGRDNVIDNNLFVDCQRGVSGGWYPGNDVWKQIVAGRTPPGVYTSPLYLKRYPEIAGMTTTPGVNHIWRNVFYHCGPVATGDSAHLDLFENAEFSARDTGVTATAAGELRQASGSRALARVGFRPIPTGEIGLYDDAYRAGLTPRR